MSKQEALPDHWRVALETKGVQSLRGLATKAGISPMAASRLVKGDGTSAETVNAVADALFQGDRNYVWQLHGSSVRDYGDWGLPSEASLLTDDQRKAVVAVVRAMLPPEAKGGGAGVKRAAPTSKRRRLSAVDDNVRDAVAADDPGTSTAAEQEHTDES